MNHKQVPSTELNSLVCRKQMKAREEKGVYLRGSWSYQSLLKLGEEHIFSTAGCNNTLQLVRARSRWSLLDEGSCPGKLSLLSFYFDSRFQEGCKACPPLRALLGCFFFLPIARLGLLLDSKMLRVTINRKTVCSFILFTQLPWILLCLNPLSLPLSVGWREKNGLFSICVYFYCSLKYFMAF